MRSFQMCKERLEGLEEEVDGPRQELEEKKKEEERRRKKIAQLQKEIQVGYLKLSGCHIICNFHFTWLVGLV